MYLGHVIGNGVVRTQDGKIAAIKSFARSETKKDVRTFLGLTGYYRRFIEGYSFLAALLTDLTRKQTAHIVKWTEECESAFVALKGKLFSSSLKESKF